MKEKIKSFIKENYKFILVLILLVLFTTVRLPYYIMTTGGTINITDRVEMTGYEKDKKDLLICYMLVNMMLRHFLIW